MSHESLPVKPERAGSTLPSPEAQKHHEKLKEQLESNAEKAHKSNELLEDARREVHETAISGTELAPKHSEKKSQSTLAPKTRAEKNKSFNTTMHHVRKDLSTPERTLSKIIHQPTIERVSDIAGKTVARPSGIIGAGIATCIGLSLIFGIAKYAGFPLSGSEMPLLIVIGMAIGLFAEWVYKSIKSLIS